MSGEYNEVSYITKKIKSNFPIYWVQIFGIVDQGVFAPNGMRISKNNKEEIKMVKKLIAKWERDIRDYHESFIPLFDLDMFDDYNDEKYEFQEFKDIFAKELWTVRGALRSFDPDLDLYKSKFHHTPGEDIFNTVRDILTETNDYMKNVAKKVDFKRVKSICDLRLDYLDENSMFLPGIIGLGIRSELLHRVHPSQFSIMTRRSGWAMYYLTDECDEFVIDEEFDGKHRTSFFWEYEYDRFSLYCNLIFNLLEEKLKKYDISLNPKYRFGYVNLFLNEIFTKHKEQASFLNKWRLVRA
ncbi:hypothetical protein [Neobacillus drentensis]|uniref:hypothetical protein n=1 Tax=Neobacillus drentensis TaxID=220684 RepID=UPI00300055C7